MTTFEYGKVCITCRYENTRTGFRHVADLTTSTFGPIRDTAKATYQNRTWESFTYETVLLALLHKTDALTARQKNGICKKYRAALYEKFSDKTEKIKIKA